MDQSPKCKRKTMKLRYDTKNTNNKEKVNWTSSKLKTFVHQEREDNPQCEKIFTNYISKKQLIS